MSIDADAVRQAMVGLELVADASGLEDARPLQDQGLDSLDVANLLLHLEETHSVRIPDAEAEKMRSIRDIVDVVNAKLAAK